ncbi:hypothetical protein DITRI_Ditri15bG0050500 [Diplodiscus trichospermus]
MAKRKTVCQLPPDIIANILSRLPVKSLLRSKCVSKPWQSLISDPQFAKLHLNQSQKNSNINPHRVLVSTNPMQSIDYEAHNGSEHGSKGVLELDYPAPIEKDPEYDVELVGSCNGLICLVVDYKDFILWNPSTRQSRELPKPKHRPNRFSVYGLGYDFSTDDYKLLRVARQYPAIASDEAKLEVLSMTTNVWRRIPDLQTDQMKLDGCGIFLNGSLHFLARKVSSLNKILSFDLAKEKFHELVPLPDRLEENHYVGVLGLGVSGDCLCLFIECGENLYEGWVMKEFGVKSSWTRLFSSPVDPWPGYKYYQSALCYTKDGKVLIDFDGYRLDMFDSKEQRFENLAIRNNWDWFHSIAYTESLVSPHF